MLTAKTLAILADAADMRAAELEADAGTSTRHLAQEQRIAAADARATIHAGSGYGTPETLALAEVVDNDREMAGVIARLVADHLARYAPGRTPDGLREGASHLADAIAEAVEGWAGFEGMTGSGSRWRTVELPEVAHALARAAFRAVDWLGLALHYLGEAVLQEGATHDR